MSDEFKVIWSAVAEQDLKGIIRHIAHDSPETALNIFRKIKKQASSLYAFPERGRIIPELEDQGIWIYRELIIAPWRLMYRISDDVVYVLSVIDSRRNVEDVLLNRMSECGD